MATEYPYMISNNKIALIIDSLISAAKPEKFTHNFLKNMGYGSSNDRAIIPLFKKLYLLQDDGTPTEYYDQLRNQLETKKVIAMRMKELYSDLFMINQNIYASNDEEIKGAFSRITGKDAKTVGRYTATFKTLADLADFTTQISRSTNKTDNIDSEKNDVKEKNEVVEENKTNTPIPVKAGSQFHYNIQIHLPATTDISVYNAIFKSLKENLVI